MMKALKLAAGAAGMAVLLLAAGATFLGYYRRASQSAVLNQERLKFRDVMSSLGPGGSGGTASGDRYGPFDEKEYTRRDNKINDGMLCCLEELHGISGLVGLDLSENPITDAGLIHLKGLTSLVYLQLGNTEITDRGLVHLWPLVNLEVIDLAGTKVTQGGAKYLGKLPKLMKVYSCGTALQTVHGVEVDRTELSYPWLNGEHRPDLLRGPLSARYRAVRGKELWEPSDGAGPNDLARDKNCRKKAREKREKETRLE